MKHFISFSAAVLVGCLFVGGVLNAEASGYASVRPAVVQQQTVDSSNCESGYWVQFAAAAAAE